MNPGPVFTVLGGKIKNDIAGPATERLLIFGTAVDGPINTPVNITNTVVAERLFGPANYAKGYKDPNTSTESGEANGASIPLAIAQAIAGGSADIWVVRCTGSYARAASAFSNTLDIRSVFPGRIYNEVTITNTVANNLLTMTVSQPAIKGGSFSYTGTSSAMSVSEFIDQINNHPNNKTIFIVKETWPAYVASAAYSAIGSGTATLSGGTNGTRARGEDYGPEVATGVNGYATKLTTVDTGSFDSIKNLNFKFNQAVLADIYVDDQVVNGANAVSTTIAYDFVQFLDACSTYIGPCAGTMAVRPPMISDDTSYINYITGNLLATTPAAYNSTLRWNKAGPFLYNGFLRPDPLSGTLDLGSRLSVIAGPEIVMRHPDIGNYTTMWHVTYASMLTTTPPERSTQNKQVPGAIAFGRSLPQKYAAKLSAGVGYDDTNPVETGKGAYVCLVRDRLNYNGPFVIYDDPTAAPRDDYFRQYQLMHLANAIHNDLDRDLAKFLGGPTSIQAIAAMETIVTNRLEGYANSGALRGGKGKGYSFKITMDGTDEDLGAVRVFLTIDPARALRTIYFTVAVSKLQ